jgi:hypothetical protein
MIRRLTKRQVEQLTASYDIDPIGALTVALQQVVGVDWPLIELVHCCPSELRVGVLNGDVSSSDALLRLLIESRGGDLTPRPAT